MPKLIDVHCHILNARDVPIKEIVKAYDMPDWFAEIIQKRLVKMTKPDFNFFNAESGYPEEKRRYFKWVSLIINEHKYIIDSLISNYQDIDLFVPLLVDFWLISNDNPIVDIQKQISNTKELVISYEGKLHPFAPFDPRSSIKDANYLNTIKTSILCNGFIGIKLYPPMGFKPEGNDNQKIDSEMEKLFTWCNEECVPITIHCSPTGARADKKFIDYSKPDSVWDKIVNQYKNINFNFAHYGGVYHNVEDSGNKWFEGINTLIFKYNNVYTDFSGYSQLEDHNARNTIFHMINNAICNNNSDILDRLMYGSDWHMSLTSKHSCAFKDMYNWFKQAFTDYTNGTINNFFGNNAMNFLGLCKGGKNRARLETFYLNNSIKYPEWFKDQ
jgi:predicted TIM-barrel fold metal-dependent hydrolase